MPSRPKDFIPPNIKITLKRNFSPLKFSLKRKLTRWRKLRLSLLCKVNRSLGIKEGDSMHLVKGSDPAREARSALLLSNNVNRVEHPTSSLTPLRSPFRLNPLRSKSVNTTLRALNLCVGSRIRVRSRRKSRVWSYRVRLARRN